MNLRPEAIIIFEELFSNLKSTIVNLKLIVEDIGVEPMTLSLQS
ncbi:MAG TPA: hypothetical protein VFK94_00720 [Patescibacteria group bacterium]|nr:hypothetical protein [Patescibacteria group bacterium]